MSAVRSHTYTGHSADMSILISQLKKNNITYQLDRVNSDTWKVIYINDTKL